MDPVAFDRFLRRLMHSASRRSAITATLASLLGLTAIVDGDAKPKSGRKARRKPKAKKPVKCKRPRRKCGNKCVNVKADRKNCGKCKRKCRPGQSCKQGKCKSTGPKPPTGGAGGLFLPIPAGHRVQVHHGYNDPLPGQPCVIPAEIDHCLSQKYSLDFVTTTNQVIAPVDGLVRKMSSEFVFIDLQRGDGVGVALGHFASIFVRPGDRVEGGKTCLGTIGTHYHYNLERRWQADGSERPMPWDPVPFTGVYKLEGENLTPNETKDQKCWTSDCFITSSNPGYCSTTSTYLYIEAAVIDPLNNKSIFEHHLPTPQTVSVEVAAWLGDQETRKTGQVTYDMSREAFVGTVDFGMSLTNTDHAIYIKFRDRARTKWSTRHVVRVVRNKVNVVPRFTLIPADADNNNIIDSSDYDLIASCYTLVGQPETCSGEKFRAADIDLNGTVNEFDLNLYTRVKLAGH